MPQRNMLVTETSSNAPRPLRFSRKCPPPGINQPKATAGAQAPIGAIGCFCSFSLAILRNLLSLAASPSGLHASETGRLVDAARPVLLRHLWIDAQRPRSYHFAAGHLGRPQRIRRRAVLHPLAQRARRIEHVRP